MTMGSLLFPARNLHKGIAYFLSGRVRIPCCILGFCMFGSGRILLCHFSGSGQMCLFGNLAIAIIGYVRVMIVSKSCS